MPTPNAPVFLESCTTTRAERFCSKNRFLPPLVRMRPGCFALGLLQTDLTARVKRGRSHRRRRLATSFGSRGEGDPPSGFLGLWRPGGLSDARVIREGPTIADVYIDISPFYGMAPATVSGYRSGGRRYA